MRVRPFRPTDLAPLIALAPLGHAPLVTAAVARAVLSENEILVAEDEGQVVGQVWLDVSRRRREGVAIIWALRVIPGRQAHGVGRVLLATAERLAARLGFARVEIGVAEGEPRLVAMYRRHGYRPVGRRVDVESWRTPNGVPQSTRFAQAIYEKEVSPMPRPALGVRWTIGDVRERGFVALRLSIAAAHRLFGNGAEYLVCVNSIDVESARLLTGEVPPEVRWQRVPDAPPDWLRASLGPGMADGVAWKLLPVRCFPDQLELSLDNDVVFWSVPPAMQAWLDDGRHCLLAEDVRPAFGQFSARCGARPLNTGIRGLPPGFDLEQRLRDLIATEGVRLDSELDEQGLQVAAILRDDPFVVDVADVTICSPFPPHVMELGRHGAHFVGLNTKRLPFPSYDGRSSELVRAEHFDQRLDELIARVQAAG